MTRPTCEDTVLVRHRSLQNDYYSLTFGPYSRAAECRPGQFVHIQLPSTDIFFRRAFSVAGVWAAQRQIEIILKVFGRGSQALARLRKGERVNLLGPLGAPFRLAGKKETAVMVAGGIGLPPLLFLASRMVERGFDPGRIEFFYGGRGAADIVERSRIRKLRIKLRAITEDGSYGTSGLVTEPLEQRLAAAERDKLRIFACGPEGMLKATNELGLKYGIPGQLSLEAPMPCGIGICLGCVVKLTKGGYARVCCEGPVFDIGEVEL